MSMVGLFWITQESVHLGGPPDSLGRAVLISDMGLEAIGEKQRGTWAWADVHQVPLLDVPVRSAVRRGLSTAWTLTQTAAFGGIEEAPAMTVGVETAGDITELTVSTSAAGGYGQDEFDLSQALLDRFAEGSARPSSLTRWARTHAGGTPPRAAREELLRQWAKG
ncbi:hypothetical protein [Streptomyces apocyni]|uniref:hypothetical protein n=1 Tax=Streptomyces apocyni TaxID=2654677 RepID=UPI0012E9A97A|nr:hypothetical protein [Streptomyces apocyni]